MSKFSHRFQEKTQSVKTFEQDLKRDREEYIIDVLEYTQKSFDDVYRDLYRGELLMRDEWNELGITQSDLRAAARRKAYRKTSAALGIISGALSLIALPFSYFLLAPVMFVSAVVMILGSLLVAMRHTTSGAWLIILGAFSGGFFGLPILLLTMLARSFGPWVSRLPLVPLGFALPVASFVLALMSLGPSKGEYQPLQEA